MIARLPVVAHVRALHAMRAHYAWHGVWAYLRCPSVTIPGTRLRAPGWVLLACCPNEVRHSQNAIANGVMG